MKIDFTCRLCRKPGTCDLPADFEAIMSSAKPAMRESIENIAMNMLCHHDCHVIYMVRRETEERIFAQCHLVSVANQLGDDGRPIIEEVRKRLNSLTRRWSMNEAKSRGSSILFWSPDFVSTLIDRPDKCGWMLKSTREQIAEKCK